MRHLYTLLFYLLTPAIVARLFWRSRKLPAYRSRILERFAFFPNKNIKKSLWIHAVSYGEAVAAEPLIKALMQTYPDRTVVVTTMTPTGSERIQKTFGNTIFHVYVPYDMPDAINRFLSKINPDMAIFMEMELWPNIINTLHEKKIPLMIANARLSEKSERGYKRIQFITEEMIRNVTSICSQTKSDAKRFTNIGAKTESVRITGSIKFDVDLPQDLIEQGKILRDEWSANTPVFIAASTHEGEEEKILSAYQLAKTKQNDLRLILVPRHPDRFDEVANNLKKYPFAVTRRSVNKKPSHETDIFLGDTMGEMFMYYSMADICFVGGSLMPIGGHNLLEPMALDKPTLTGPHYFNSQEITNTLVENHAIKIVNDENELANEIETLMHDQEQAAELITQGKKILGENKGALKKHLQIINSILKGTSGN